MVAKGSMTEQEGRKFVEEMSGYAEKTKTEIEKQVNGYVEKAIDRMNLVRKSDLEKIQSSIEAIQRQLEKDQGEKSD